nr:hypothetical protein [uncultured Dyadobacter sp.]
MAQIIQSIYTIAPILLTVALAAAAIGGFWLVIDLKRKSAGHRYSVSDRLFFKRNANRLRKMQLH